MLTILFLIGAFWIFEKLFVFGLKMSWGILKILLTIGFLPLILIGMVLIGLIKIAFPILIVVGIIALFQKSREQVL